MDSNSVISQIGNTPLVRLKQASELTGCHIYVKLSILILRVVKMSCTFYYSRCIKEKLISKGGTTLKELQEILE